MTTRVKTYLRTFRRRSGLTQAELAFLLGAEDGAQVSRYERPSRSPNLRTALGLQAVFGVSADRLVPGIYAEVDRSVIRRVRLLSRQLERHSDSARSKRKLRFLLSVMARGGAVPKQTLWERDENTTG
jgi:transcriptional regulator with XRE-family HTH domain